MNLVWNTCYLHNNIYSEVCEWFGKWRSGFWWDLKVAGGGEANIGSGIKKWGQISGEDGKWGKSLNSQHNE